MRPIASTDLDVFPLCLGGNVFGWTADTATSFEVLDAFASAGGNFFDTSDVYWKFKPGNSGGESETIIGAWMRQRHCRDRMVVSTKIGCLDGMTGGLTAAQVRHYTEQSMRRLGVETIDLLYAHTDDPDTPLEETLGAFDALVREGKVQYVAASRFTADRLSEALSISEREGFARFVAVQPLYSLVERAYEQELAPLVERAGLSTMPFYALAAGFLTGKYRPGVEVESARAEGASRYLDDAGVQLLAVLDDVAAAHETNVAAVSLAWLIAKPTITAPIASARTVGQLKEIIQAVTLRLSPEEERRLDEVSAARLEQAPSQR